MDEIIEESETTKCGGIIEVVLINNIEIIMS